MSCKICGSKAVYGFGICYACYLERVHNPLHVEYQTERRNTNYLVVECLARQILELVSKAPTNK